MSTKIGVIKKRVIDLTGLDIPANTPIYIGDSNISHMEKSHPDDYKKYRDKIKEILDTPTYIGVNPKDGSIEYVKEYLIDNEFVKVAVRVSTNGIYFARTLYVLNNGRVDRFIRKGTLKKY